MDSEPQTIFLELTQFNNTNSEQVSELRYTGSDIISNQTRIWVYKFALNTSNFPLYVPKIIDTFVPFLYNQNTVSVVNNPMGYYMMDWAITVVFDDGTSKTAPVLWEKLGFRPPYSDTTALYQKYFWLNNSDQLCEYINNAFVSLCGPNVAYIVKNADRWSLLTNTTSKIVSIHFNDEMRQYFTFNYNIQNNGIKIVKMQIVSLDNKTYYSNTTPTSNNKLLVFDRLIFKSQQFPINAIYSQEANSDISNFSTAAMLSYSISDPDISVIGNSIIFNATSKDRCSSLNSDYLPNFTIEPYFVSKNNQLFRISLEKNDKIEFCIMFF